MHPQQNTGARLPTTTRRLFFKPLFKFLPPPAGGSNPAQLAARSVTKRNSLHFGLELVVSWSKPFKATCLQWLSTAVRFFFSPRPRLNQSSRHQFRHRQHPNHPRSPSHAQHETDSGPYIPALPFMATRAITCLPSHERAHVSAMGFEPMRTYVQWILSPPP